MADRDRSDSGVSNVDDLRALPVIEGNRERDHRERASRSTFSNGHAAACSKLLRDRARDRITRKND
jgi:hypothetical protein